MRASYWQRLAAQRLSRRRVLLSVGATATGAALIAACGGDNDSGSGGPKDQSSLVSKATDETKSGVKRGGTLKTYSGVDPAHLDPHITGSSQATASHVYSALFRVKDGYLENTSGEIEGDVIESWELAPDKLTIVAKVHPGAQFSPLPPVNGRPLDANDVVFSWERFKSIGTTRGEYVNEVNQDAPILGITAPDERTVVIALKEPNATVFSLLANNAPGSLLIAAKEGADPNVLDLRRVAIGSGPWYLSDFQPGAGFYFKRNPGFKQDKRDLPYMDGIDWPVLREYATGLAQFRAGAIYNYAVRAEEVVDTKRDLPNLVMMETPIVATGIRTAFGLQESSPFRDERVRQAWVLSWDRDLYLDVVYNVANFEKDGFGVRTAYNTALAASAWEGWWLDPKSKEFGPTGRYVQYNLAETKKLLAAAGFLSGVELDLHHPANSGSGYPASYYRQLEALLAVVQPSNLFHWKVDTPNYTTEWAPQYRNGHGQFNGVAVIYDTALGDPVTNLYARYHPAGALTQGTDAAMAALLNGALKEFDFKRRQAMVHEVQRQEGRKQYYPWVGGAAGFALSWPVLRNQMTWQGGSGRDRATWFLDPAKAKT